MRKTILILSLILSVFNNEAQTISSIKNVATIINNNGNYIFSYKDLKYEHSNEWNSITFSEEYTINWSIENLCTILKSFSKSSNKKLAGGYDGYEIEMNNGERYLNFKYTKSGKVLITDSYDNGSYCILTDEQIKYLFKNINSYKEIIFSN